MGEIMKAAHLLKDELEYELSIRSIKSKRDSNEKRKILARLLDKERDVPNKLVNMNAYPFNFENEKTGIETTLQSIKELIEDFVGTETDPLFLRLKSRLIHVSSRINRMPLIASEPSDAQQAAVWKEQVEFQKESFATSLVLEADLYEKLSSQAAPVSRSTHAGETIPKPVPHVTTYEKISKWNVKFDGDPKKLYSFLELVTELAKSRKTSDDALFSSAVEFFTGDAFVWFRSVQSNLRDWDSLVLQLKKDFLPKDIDEEIWEQIKNRKQQKKEKVTIFIATMENLFSRLSRVPHETTRVKHIRQNLHVEYYKQLALQAIETVAQLKDLAKRLEDSSLYLSNEKPTNKDHFCFSCTSDEKNNSANFKAKGKSRNNFTKNYQRESPNSRQGRQYANTGGNITCWNCNLANHTYQHCTQKRKLFCYRCGKAGIKSNNCNCAKNE